MNKFINTWSPLLGASSCHPRSAS